MELMGYFYDNHHHCCHLFPSKWTLAIEHGKLHFKLSFFFILRVEKNGFLVTD